MRKELTIPIYDCRVDVVVVNSDEEYDDAILDAGYNGDGNGDAITLHYTDNSSFFVMIFKRDCLSPGNIAHEGQHLLMKIMESRGIKYDFDNQEPVAYLMGFIIDGLHQIIYGNENG